MNKEIVFNRKNYKRDVLRKFGRDDYELSYETYHTGIDIVIGDYIAQRFKGYNTILEVCTGAGFMLIPLAKIVRNIITVEINSEYLKQAKHNVKVAGIKSNIIFILGDILEEKIMSKIPKIDAAFLDPDWSVSVKHNPIHITKLSDMHPPIDILLEQISKKTQNFAIRLPKQLNLNELKSFPPHELEKIYLDGDFKFYCVYFGELTRKIGITKFEAFSLS